MLAGAGDGRVGIPRVYPALKNLDPVEGFHAFDFGLVCEQPIPEGFLPFTGFAVGFLAAADRPRSGVADAFDVGVGLRPLAVDPRPLGGVHSDPQHEPVFPARRVAEEVVCAFLGNLVGLDDMHRLAEAGEARRGGLDGDAVGAAEDFFAGLLGELGLHAAVACPRVVFGLKINNSGVPGGAFLHDGDFFKSLAAFSRQKLGIALLERLGALEIVFYRGRVAFDGGECDEEDAISVQQAESDGFEPVKGD